jgi:hypothetical protein
MQVSPRSSGPLWPHSGASPKPPQACKILPAASPQRDWPVRTPRAYSQSYLVLYGVERPSGGVRSLSDMIAGFLTPCAHEARGDTPLPPAALRPACLLVVVRPQSTGLTPLSLPSSPSISSRSLAASRLRFIRNPGPFLPHYHPRSFKTSPPPRLETQPPSLVSCSVPRPRSTTASNHNVDIPAPPRRAPQLSPLPSHLRLPPRLPLRLHELGQVREVVLEQPRCQRL